MTKFNKPLNEILTEDFLPSLKGNSTFTKQQFVDWLEKYYPGFADSTVTNWLTRLSTNLEARLNWPIRKEKDDVLFKLEKANTFRPYDQKLDSSPKYFKFSRIMRRCGQLGIPYKTVIESPYAVGEGKSNGEVQYRDGENETVGWGDKKELISGKHTTPHSFEEMLNFLGLNYDRSTNQYHHQSQYNSASSSSDAIEDLNELPEGIVEPEKTYRLSGSYARDAKVRSYVIARAKGVCEYCGEEGFLMSDGKRHYLEAHHIIALADEGRDTIENVIALCPRHHREAHYGVNRVKLEAEMAKLLKSEQKMSNKTVGHRPG